MGVKFEFRHSNFFGYLTDHTGRNAPRSSRQLCEEFIMSLEYSDPFQSRLISYDVNWLEEIRAGARRSSKILQKYESDLLSSSIVGNVLAPFRPFFRNFPINVLILKEGQNNNSYLDDFWDMAREVEDAALFLFPDHVPQYNDFLDPFPAIKALADNPIKPPLALIWTPEGSSCAVSLHEALEFLPEIIFDLPLQKIRHRHLDHNGVRRLTRSVARLNDRIQSKSDEVRNKKILHMSDLHFGNEVAARRRTYLKSYLNEILIDIDRVVITGDLFDEPNKDFAREFNDFRNDIERMTNNDIIVVPGNHDVRKHGNKLAWLGENYKTLADVRLVLVHPDKQLKTVFFCFNSAEGADFARGEVSDDQLMRVANEYDRQKKKDPSISEYLKVALVHHHPVKYEPSHEPTTWHEKLFRALGFKQDAFLEFENAVEYLNWCEKMQVSLILHGHKHIPRQIKGPSDSLIVGCGSTTGVEGYPMCYDVITLNPKTGRWSPQFYQDIDANGAGFKLQSIILNTQ